MVILGDMITESTVRLYPIEAGAFLEQKATPLACTSTLASKPFLCQIVKKLKFCG